MDSETLKRKVYVVFQPSWPRVKHRRVSWVSDMVPLRWRSWFQWSFLQQIARKGEGAPAPVTHPTGNLGSLQYNAYIYIHMHIIYIYICNIM